MTKPLQIASKLGVPVLQQVSFSPARMHDARYESRLRGQAERTRSWKARPCWRQVVEPLLQPMPHPDTVPIHPARALLERCQQARTQACFSARVVSCVKFCF